MRESCTYGVVRGALSNERPYRDRHCLGRGASAPNPEILCRLLQQRQNASIIEQRCAGLSPNSASRTHQITRHPGRTSSSLRPGLGFRYTQAYALPFLVCRVRRAAPAPRLVFIHELLQCSPNAPCLVQGCTRSPPDSAIWDYRGTARSGRTASSIRQEGFTVGTPARRSLMFEMEKVHLPALVARDYPLKLRIRVAGVDLFVSLEGGDQCSIVKRHEFQHAIVGK